MIARRTKWFEAVKPIEPGDLVIVLDGNSRNQWRKGRVLQAIKGIDGQVRRATIQTTSGIISRPALKLAVLDIDETRQASNGDCASGRAILHGPGDVAVTTGQIQRVKQPSIPSRSGRTPL